MSAQRPDYVPRAWRGRRFYGRPFLVLLVLLVIVSVFATAIIAAVAARHYTFAVIIAVLTAPTFARNLWIYGPRAWRAWRTGEH